MDYVINLKQVSKKYSGKVAVYDYSLVAKPGTIVGLLGPNGSGKSTLIRIMTGLMTPCTAVGHCMGYDVLKDNTHIRSNIGYMPQKFSLYRQLTVLENIRLFADIHQLLHPKQHIESIIDAFELGKYAHHYANTLSGGWQQRLALAVSVVHQPTLLILDEPTAGVDPDSRQIIWQKIQELSQQGMTIIVATHYMDEAVKSHFLQFLFYGKIVAQGSRQELIKQSQLTTWEVFGDQVRAVQAQLNQLNPQLQILEYGDHLRISAIETKVEQAINEVSTAFNCTVRHIPPSLEDCFVFYSSICKDTRL